MHQSHKTSPKDHLPCINQLLQKFHPDLSSLLAPLNNLLHKGTKWTWTKSIFDKVKNLLQSSVVLAHYDPSKK